MFNIFKVAHYFQNVSTLPQLPDTLIPEPICNPEFEDQ